MTTQAADWEGGWLRQATRLPSPNFGPRPAQASRDPFFDQPYEPKLAPDARPEWEGKAGAYGIQDFIGMAGIEKSR